MRTGLWNSPFLYVHQLPASDAILFKWLLTIKYNSKCKSFLNINEMQIMTAFHAKFIETFSFPGWTCLKCKISAAIHRKILAREYSINPENISVHEAIKTCLTTALGMQIINTFWSKTRGSWIFGQLECFSCSCSYFKSRFINESEVDLECKIITAFDMKTMAPWIFGQLHCFYCSWRY